VSPAITDLRTRRLVLRSWRDSDRGPFAALNADPRVMEHFPKALTRGESDAMVDRMNAAINTRGFGFWAVEVQASEELIGFVGLSVPTFEAPFMPCVEIGWRIAFEHWGKGFATEGARASLDAAFGELGLPEVVSFTTTTNDRSKRVMERLGMRHDERDDFDHPAIAEGHPLRRHVLYRIRAR
jgi:ribosomal-protein-alanine N-acetyltransferase